MLAELRIELDCVNKCIQEIDLKASIEDHLNNDEEDRAGGEGSIDSAHHTEVFDQEPGEEKFKCGEEDDDEEVDPGFADRIHDRSKEPGEGSKQADKDCEADDGNRFEISTAGNEPDGKIGEQEQDGEARDGDCQEGSDGLFVEIFYCFVAAGGEAFCALWEDNGSQGVCWYFREGCDPDGDIEGACGIGRDDSAEHHLIDG